MSWKDRKVVILGLARQGKALARYLVAQGANVVVSDLKRAQALEAELEEMSELPVSYVLGDHPLELLDGADTVFISGGVPANIQLVLEARMRGIRISNDSQLFLELCPAPVIGITGSAGKSTTTELVGRVAKVAMQDQTGKAWTGGNLGRPLIMDINQIGGDDWAIIELSSFQLEIMTESPHIAAVLNLTPNHLDRHRTMEAYREAKLRILSFQGEGDIAVLNREEPGSWGLRSEVRGRLVSFGLDQTNLEEGTFVDAGQVMLRKSGEDFSVCPLSDISLLGTHNLENVLAACAIAGSAGFPTDAMAKVIRDFHGLPHRLEFIRRVRGADWYNDSIATSPERAIAAMNSFQAPIILIAGGRDKDLPWDDFAGVVEEKVEHLILFGEAREKIEGILRELQALDGLLSFQSVSTLTEAVGYAAQVVKAGDVVLLAPGGTSFDQYVDFEERGEDFRSLVESLT